MQVLKNLGGFVWRGDERIVPISPVLSYNHAHVKSLLGKGFTIPGMTRHLSQQWDLMLQPSIGSSWLALKSHGTQWLSLMMMSQELLLPVYTEDH